MSINLHCKIKGNEINLLQTPTNISNMICVDSKGIAYDGLNGLDAIRAMRSYCEWVRYRWNDDTDISLEEFRILTKEDDEHIKEIERKIKKVNDIEVWIQ